MDTTRKTAAIAGTVIGTALVIWPLAVWLQVLKCEKPKYKVLKTLGTSFRSFYDRTPAIELREYSSYVIAEVTVQADDLKEANSKGFKQVAGFIFGGNKKEEKISMTSPVQSEYKQEEANGEKNGKGEKIAMTVPVTTLIEGGRYKIAFVMPSKYTSTADLPKPDNEEVKLFEVPSHHLAAISWRGSPAPTANVIRSKEKDLRKALDEAGVSLTVENASTRLYQYYPPFAPQWLRLQDVLLPIDSKSIPAKSATDSKTE